MHSSQTSYIHKVDKRLGITYLTLSIQCLSAFESSRMDGFVEVDFVSLESLEPLAAAEEKDLKSKF